MIGFESSIWLAIITIPVGILAGVVSGKRPIRKKCLVVFYVIVAIIFWFLAFTPGEETASPWAFCIIMGLCASVIPTYTRGITPILVTDGFKTDMALMCMALVTGLAQVLAFVSTSTIAAIGWFANSQFVLAPLALVAASGNAFPVCREDEKIEYHDLPAGFRASDRQQKPAWHQVGRVGDGSELCDTAQIPIGRLKHQHPLCFGG